jgi:hypothetical protein
MGSQARALQSAVLVVFGVTLIVSAVATGRPLSSGLGSMVVGAVLLAGAALVSQHFIRQYARRRRDVRRGLRQIETVLRLEAALTSRRLTVGGAAQAGCPICGAPAGPHCVCRKH